MEKQYCYLLIGGSGFLGSAFSAYLRRKGITPTIIERGQISNAGSFQISNEIIDKFGVSEVKNIIIDFAYTSIPNTSFSDPVKDFSENLYNVNNHLAFADKLPNASYIYVSSGGTVYGNVAEHKPIKETAENLPLSPYGITKLASEKYTLMHQAIYGLDVRIVRPANLYGPGQKPFRGQGFVATALAKVIQRQAIQIFGDGNSVRDYLYVEEFNEALYQVITNGHSGNVYNIGSEKGYSTNDLITLISSIMNIDVELQFLPARPFDVIYNVLDCSKLKAIGGWADQTNIEQGIEQTLEWIKSYLSNTNF